MNVAIIGFEVEGKAALDYYRQQNAQITVCDQDEHKLIPDGAKPQLGDNYLDELDRFDVIFRSAGVPPSLILDKNPGVQTKITTAINEFLRVCPTKHVIGVTGTKGKGTTATLITNILEAAHKSVYLGGNIGLPPFAFLDKLTEDSWVILELSSFQLIDLKYSPAIAICLMVVPEHLNWHKDLDEYLLAKAQLFEHQTVNDLAVYFHQNELSQKIAGYGSGFKIPYYARPGAYVDNDTITIAGNVICHTDELQLLGQHNWQNVCAAVTVVWQITQNMDAIRSVLTTFSGLKHRLEFVREVENVKYYDDSFGTTPETAIVAIEAFAAPKVVILGGSDKGADYSELAKTVAASNVRHVILIGDMAPQIQASLQAQNFTAYTSGSASMSDIVQAAQNVAQPGDVVLLSTGCASFGLFHDYKDRGEQFSRAVAAL